MSGRFLSQNAFGVGGKGFFPARQVPAAVPVALNWTSRSSPAPDSIVTGGFGHNVFLGLIDTIPGDVVRSTDNGSTWTLENAIGPAAVGVAGIATDGIGVWMFGTGSNGVTDSFPFLSIDDGQNWAPTLSSPFGHTAGTAAVACAPGAPSRWVVFGNTATQGLVSFSDNQGATWSAPAAIAKAFDNDAAFFDGTHYLTVGTSLASAPALYSSTDALTWTETLLPATALRNRPIASGNGHFIVGDGSIPSIYVSATIAGLTGASPIPVTFFPDTADTSIYSVGYGLFQGLPTFVAIGVFGGSALSQDNGATWSSTHLNFPPPASGNAAQVVVFGNNTFVASGDAGDISTLP